MKELLIMIAMKFKKGERHSHEQSMRDRFVLRVLLPPFLLLILIGGVSFFQLTSFLRNQAVDELQTSADATAIRLERELAIRETVLKNTAQEITNIKSAYVTNLTELNDDREACTDYYNTRFTFIGSTNDACDRFGTQASLQSIEDGYIEQAQDLQSTEINSINQRLSAFKQFFPETIALLLTNSSGDVVSSAVSGKNLSSDDFITYAQQGLSEQVLGAIHEKDGLSLSIFAFPISEGSVLVAYDINDPNFISPSWRATPVDSGTALTVIVHKDSMVVYPNLEDESEFIENTKSIQQSGTATLDGIDNVVVSQDVLNSDWQVFVASPEAVVFSTVRDTQITAIIIAGLFIIGFLWVGSFFIKKTTDNIAKLITGAIVYGSGRLDYKLDVDVSEKEFRQLADTMQSMARRIAKSEKENDERNKEFISIATHELRAPMTSIIGYLSMLQENLEKKLSEQDKMILDTAYDGTIRLRDLVNDMLDAARLEGGREEFVFEQVKINEAVSECIESMKIVAKENNIKLLYKDEHATTVYVDPAKLRIILNNFVSNAIKYNHKGGHVHISHTIKDGHIITSVANSGPTIPQDQQDHMFEKFFRVDTPEHRKVTGTGIGMFVTKQYVEAMGGEVWFTSQPKQDTTFSFSLPTGNSRVKKQPTHATPKPANSKWIMRWRKRLR